MPIFATVKMQVLSSSDYSNEDNSTANGNPNANDYANNSSDSSEEERRQVTSTSEEELTNSNARWVTFPCHNSKFLPRRRRQTLF